MRPIHRPKWPFHRSSSIVDNAPLIALPIILSVVVISFLSTWQGSDGFNLADEGFLWYGVQRVMLGEVPIRDFSAYDPGRYYWSAALMSLWGDSGIMSLRAAVAIFQTMGLFTGLALIAQSSKTFGKEQFFYLVIAAATLAVWMFPRHKLFDISSSIFLIGALTFLILNPTTKRYFIAGVTLGFIAVFGRNHGMYGAAGSLGVMIWLSIRRNSGPGFLEGLVFWVAGVVTGFSPILLMLLATPGFAPAFLDSIRFLFEQKATNLPLPIPWPWTISLSAVPLGDVVRGWFVGLFFIGTIIFGILGICWAVWQRLYGRQVPPAFVASAFLGIPYAHHAFSRADVGHLAQSMFPFLVGCFSLLSIKESRVKWPLAISLCGASFLVMSVFHPGWQCHQRNACVDVEISGDRLKVDPVTASDIALLRRLDTQYAPNGESFLVTPLWPAAYSPLARQSPTWEIYPTFHRSETFEKEEINASKPLNPVLSSFLIIHWMDARIWAFGTPIL